jgi:hypothetical protein
MARLKSLDDDVPLPRCQEHSNVLVEMLELGILWDKYGLVCDVVVRTLLLHPLYWPIITGQLNIPFPQPFTEDLSRADIHELLAPNILHQLIKGTFKDHLVAWVEDYLVAKHGRIRANKILDDIDRR